MTALTSWRKVAGAVVCATIAVWMLSAPALAVQPDEIMKDPAQEARARNLSRELRCMVCQNQSIDDSDAPLAKDLRVLVRERIAKGDSDSDVISFLVARYGDFVLYRPPVKSTTWLLWFGPLVLLIVGGVVWWQVARRRPRGDQPAMPGTASTTGTAHAGAAALAKARALLDRPSE